MIDALLDLLSNHRRAPPSIPWTTMRPRGQLGPYALLAQLSVSSTDEVWGARPASHHGPDVPHVVRLYRDQTIVVHWPEQLRRYNQLLSDAVAGPRGGLGQRLARSMEPVFEMSAAGPPFVATVYSSGADLDRVSRALASLRPLVWAAAGNVLHWLHAHGLVWQRATPRRVRLTPWGDAPVRLLYTCPVVPGPDGHLRALELEGDELEHAKERDRWQLACACLVGGSGYRTTRLLLDQGSPVAREVLRDQLLERLPPSLEDLLRAHLDDGEPTFSGYGEVEALVRPAELRRLWERVHAAERHVGDRQPR